MVELAFRTAICAAVLLAASVLYVKVLLFIGNTFKGTGRELISISTWFLFAILIVSSYGWLADYNGFLAADRLISWMELAAASVALGVSLIPSYRYIFSKHDELSRLGIFK